MLRSDEGNDGAIRAEKLEKSPKSIAPLEEQKRDIRDSMMNKWLENYTDKMYKYWDRLPSFAGTLAATIALFLLGACFRGEWMLIFVFFARRYGFGDDEEVAGAISSGSASTDSHSAEASYLRTFLIMASAAVIVSYTVYFSMGGFLHYYYYVRQRHRAEDWKCQPYKWLSPKLERHEIILGVSSLMLTNLTTAMFGTYLIHGGPSMIYYQFGEYGWLWFFLQWPVIFLIIDYTTYWFHRLYHRPTLYKWFHKLHHTYKQPTAWSATAIHPVEITHVQMCYLVPLFIIPCHLVPYITIMMYNFCHGIIDHSGINFKAQWWQPWQPDAFFHDNHHQYTHVNFGFNMFFWDKLHGTLRRKDRIYNENIFYGRGKSLSEATKEELQADVDERVSEHVDNKTIFVLNEKLQDAQKID